MDTGIAFAAVTTRNEGVQGHRQARLFRPSDDRAFQVRRSAHQAHAEDDHSGAVGDLRPAGARRRSTRRSIRSSTQFFDDLGQAYSKAVRAFADAGCRYLQLDEVFIAMLCDPKYRQQMTDRGDDPEELGELYGDLINAAMSDIPSDMTITMHLCRGNYKSTFMGAGGYEAVQEILFNKIKVHGYFMEYDTERAGGFEPLRCCRRASRSCSAW